MESGTQLGHYTISSLIGKGGMGEVYQAKDEKLGRQVAIKVLPEEFAQDADRVARLRREAQMLASLNHPNIASIYGLEETEGKHFLVLELVEGPTLDTRMRQGAIPVEESLKLALQIAEALEAAHAKSVIHRDLKPANIKITPDGKVKVLDFGLAKAFAADNADADFSNSPTQSMAATQQGVILGTAAYMSPEQAGGLEVDQGSDIWAFGVVLFEMLTGRRLFTGETVTHVLASVLKTEPNWNTLPPNLHPRIRFLLERSLEKEVKRRLSNISDARIEVENALSEPGVAMAQAVAQEDNNKTQSKLPWVAAVVLALLTGVAGWTLKPTPSVDPLPVSRADYDLPEGHVLDSLGEAVLALSPDGSHFAYNTEGGVYLRRMDELEARLISGTERGDLINLFFNPDGQWIGFYTGGASGGEIEKIAISGGTPVRLGQAVLPLGASWGPDEMILFGQPAGIFRVSANGGTPELIIEAENGEVYASPRLLRDDWILFTVGRAGTVWTDARIVAQSLETGERKLLWTGREARYVPTGHLLYALGEDLFAVPFDLDALEVTGGAVPLVGSVAPTGNGSGANYEVSRNGSLVYLSGALSSNRRSLVWMDREGNAVPSGAPNRSYALYNSLSPDGLRVATTLEGDIWVFDATRETLSRLTFEGPGAGIPIWTPDGQYVTYRSARSGMPFNVFRRRADGSGPEEQLTDDDELAQTATSWLPDGRLMGVYVVPGVGGAQDRDIWIVPTDGEGEPQPFLQTPFNEGSPMFSPDGNWLMYVSDESGRNEVYVQPFPGPGGKFQISTGGGGDPVWSRDGDEIFYLNGERMMAVDIDTELGFRPGTPSLLFEGGFITGVGRVPVYDVAPDGRFLMVQASSMIDGGGPQPQINIVLNWFQELLERVPVD